MNSKGVDPHLVSRKTCLGSQHVFISVRGVPEMKLNSKKKTITQSLFPSSEQTEKNHSFISYTREVTERKDIRMKKMLKEPSFKNCH